MKTIIIDLDETLIQSTYVWAETISQLCHFLDWDMDFERGKEIFHKKTFTEILEYIMDESKTTYSFDYLLDKTMKEVARKYKEEVPSKPGALEYLKQCKEQGKRCVVLTSNFYELAQVSLSRLELLPYIDTIYSCEQMKKSKRDEQTYRHVLEQEKANASETLFIDDSIYALKVARKVGISCIGMCGNEKEVSFQKEHFPFIQDFFELVNTSS